MKPDFLAELRRQFPDNSTSVSMPFEQLAQRLENAYQLGDDHGLTRSRVDLQAENDKLRAELAVARGDIQPLRMQLDAMRAAGAVNMATARERDGLQSNLNAANALLDSRLSIIHRLCEERDNLRVELGASQASRQMDGAKLRALEAELATAIKDRNSVIDERDAALRVLETATGSETKANALRGLRVENEALEYRVELATSRIGELEGVCADRSARIRELEEACAIRSCLTVEEANTLREEVAALHEVLYPMHLGEEWPLDTAKRLVARVKELESGSVAMELAAAQRSASSGLGALSNIQVYLKDIETTLRRIQ